MCLATGIVVFRRSPVSGHALHQYARGGSHAYTRYFDPWTPITKKRLKRSSELSILSCIRRKERAAALLTLIIHLPRLLAMPWARCTPIHLSLPCTFHTPPNPQVRSLCLANLTMLTQKPFGRFPILLLKGPTDLRVPPKMKNLR